MTSKPIYKVKNQEKLTMIVAFLLGVLYTFLFYRLDIGINSIIFNSILVAILILFSIKSHRLTIQLSIVFGLIWLFGFFQGVMYSPFLLFWNRFAYTVLVILLLPRIVAYRKPLLVSKIIDYWERVKTKFVEDIKTVLRGIAIGGVIKSTRPILKGLIISFPLMISFLILFSLADDNYADLLGILFNTMFGNYLVDLLDIGRWFVLFFAACFYGILFTSFFVHEETQLINVGEALKRVRKSTKKFPQIEVATIFSVLNITFLTFVVLQIQFILRGESIIFDEGLTYSQYAVKGYNEMLVITGLGLITILGFLQYSRYRIGKYQDVMVNFILLFIG